jgi:hypothetical protein
VVDIGDGPRPTRLLVAIKAIGETDGEIDLEGDLFYSSRFERG